MQSLQKGFFILGANEVALFVADCLKQAGFDVLLADMHWGNVAAARLQGLNCYYGNIFTEYASLHMDLSQYGTLIGLAPQNEWNMLAMWHFQAEFKKKRMFMIGSEGVRSKEAMNMHINYPSLFKDGLSFSRLLKLIQNGAEYRFTPNNRAIFFR